MTLSFLKYVYALNLRNRVRELFAIIGEAHHRAGWPS